MARVYQVPPDQERCVALTRAGQRCRNPRLAGSLFCSWHSGRRAEQARRRAQLLDEIRARQAREEDERE